MIIAIVDRDQREFKNGRYPLAIMENDDDIMKFESVQEIQKLYLDHPLNVFRWWIFDMDSGESVQII